MPYLSGNYKIDALLSNTYQAHWNGAGVFSQSASLTYSFAQFTVPADTSGTQYVFTPTQENAARVALQKWANVANITFAEVTDTGPTEGDINFIDENMDPSLQLLGYAYLPIGSNPKSGEAAGDVHINEGLTFTSWAEHSFSFHVLNHEIGHALGLVHPFDSDSGSTLPGAEDNDRYTVMSYTEVFGASNVYAAGPMLYDVAAIQHLYGANLAYNSGDTTYTFGDSDTIYETIWDGGGNDTIAYTGSKSTTVNLAPGTFSSIGTSPGGSGNATNNLSIAFGATIENATGGSNDDVLLGNSVANTLVGGSGSDILNGGAGNDQLFGGTGSDRYVFDLGWGSDVVNDGDASGEVRFATSDLSALSGQKSGNDLEISSGGDSLQFVDYWLGSKDWTFSFNAGAQTFSLNSLITPNSAPTLSVTSPTLNVGESVDLASLVTMADADGDSATYWEFRDEEIGGSAYIAANGTAATPGKPVMLSGSNLSSPGVVTLVGNEVGGPDLIRVRVADDAAWSEWAEIWVTTQGSSSGGTPPSGGTPAPNSAPTLSVTSPTLNVGESVDLASLVTMADADGDSATYWEFRDEEIGGSAYIAANGTATTPGKPVMLSGSNLSSPGVATLVGNEVGGPDLIRVRVADDAAWSEWAEIWVTTQGSSGFSINDVTVDEADPNGNLSGQAYIVYGEDSGDVTNLGTANNDVLVGGAGNDTIKGASGNDTITGGAGDDALFGGFGDDLFIFGQGDGGDTVDDFTAGSATDDTLDISAFSFADLNAVLAVTTTTGTNSVIQLDADDSITLLGVRSSDLHDDDFLL